MGLGRARLGSARISLARLGQTWLSSGQPGGRADEQKDGRKDGQQACGRQEGREAGTTPRMHSHAVCISAPSMHTAVYATMCTLQQSISHHACTHHNARHWHSSMHADPGTHVHVHALIYDCMHACMHVRVRTPSVCRHLHIGCQACMHMFVDRQIGRQGGGRARGRACARTCRQAHARRPLLRTLSRVRARLTCMHALASCMHA